MALRMRMLQRGDGASGRERTSRGGPPLVARSGRVLSVGSFRVLRVISASCILSGLMHADGQTLNLGTPTAPVMGADASALAQARALRGEAESIANEGGGEGADEGASVRRQVRLLAAGLLEVGQREAESENAGVSDRGSVRLLLGRTLASRLVVIDAIVARFVQDEATRAIVAADLARLSVTPDAEIETIERGLREALAPLVGATDESVDMAGQVATPEIGGWITADAGPEAGAYRSLLSALSGTGTPLGSAGVEAMREIDGLAGRAWEDRAFRRAGESLRIALFGAAQGREGADTLPRWLTPTAKAALEPAFERAMGMLADPGRRGQGLTDLRRVARLMGLIRRTGRLADDQAGRRARESLSNYIAAPPSNRELEAQLLAGYGRALELALAPATLPDDTLLARPLRPAWREFQDAARVACGRVADALPTLLNDSAAMTDPGTLALLNGATQAMNEARGLHAITALLTGQEEPTPGVEPVPLDVHRDLATRLLTMSQVAARAGGSTSGEGAAAKRDLGALAVDVGAWRVMRGERELRAAVAAPDAGWTAATDGREHDLLDLIDRTRGAWLANVTTQGTLVERAALRARLQLLADLLPLVREVAATMRTLDEAPGSAASGSESSLTIVGPGLNDWAGWELSRPAHRLLVEGLTDAVGETVSLALRGEDERARIRIAAMRTDMAGALLPARLQLMWMETRPGAVGPLDEVGTGGADAGRAWMPARRELLAEFCRVAEELPGIRLRRDDAQDRTVRAYLATLAQDALAELR